MYSARKKVLLILEAVLIMTMACTLTALASEGEAVYEPAVYSTF